MNKQELIEKLREHGAWCTECHDINGKKDRYVKSAKVRELLDRLDEPQKVKVPEEFDEWYQQIKQQRGFSEMIARHFALWKICQFGFGHDFEDVSHERTPLDLSVWVSNHKDEDVHAILNGYEVEESKWAVKEGDLVIRKGEHEAKVYFVEGVDDDGILLVNGIKDEFFTDGPERAVDEETLSYFYGNFRLLAKKESLEVEKVEE